MRTRSSPLIVAFLVALGCGDDDSPHRVSGEAGASGAGAIPAGHPELTAKPWLSSAGGAQSSLSGNAGVSGSDTSGAAGSGGTPPEPIPVSKFCGDTIRGEFDEECDDGPGDEPDLCSNACRVTDALVVSPIDGAGSRTLGSGRHPLSAGKNGTALAFLEEDKGGVTTLNVATFDEHGKRLGVGHSAPGVTVLASANPVTAALPDGSFALSWTDINGDGDQLGVALRSVGASGQFSPSILHANQTTAFSQSGPDMLWTGSELVVAWVDNSDAGTGPDIKYRRFDATLAPLSSEQTLSVSDALETSVSLAPFGNTWAATWRQALLDGTSEIGVRVGSSTWTIGPITPGDEGDVPALVELDATHVLVVFTVGTDPSGAGNSNVTRLRSVVIDTTAAEPGPVIPIDALNSEYAGELDVAQSQPAAVRVGDEIFLTWRSGALSTGGAGQELWLKSLGWSARSATLDIGRVERALALTAKTLDDQRTPALAVSPLIPKGALLLAWEDYGSNLAAGQAKTDVVMALLPRPGLSQ